MNDMKSKKPKVGSDRFAAGLMRQIYRHNLLPEDIMKLKKEMESEEFKKTFARLSQQTQSEVQNLLPYAEQHGALDYLISFVYGGEEEDPRYVGYVKEHIRCWDNRDALLAAVRAKGAEVKREYGFEKEVDELIEKAKSLNDLTALSYIYEAFTGALINLEHLDKDMIGKRLNEAIDVLNAW